jgi:hypothetical protein
MSAAPALAAFVDDELMHAPFTLAQVVGTLADAAQALRASAAPGMDVARVLQARQGDVVNEAMQSLRSQVRAELQGSAGPNARRGAGGLPEGELALVDEDAVGVDIALARCTENVKAQAEAELLELGACTSALAGDLRIARDTNPFRPETWVRALWQGLQVLPVPRSQQATLLKQASLPLAHELRQAYAQATARLLKQGVKPSEYRTIVLAADPAGSARAEPLPENLGELLATMPAPLDTPHDEPDALEQALQAMETDIAGLGPEAGADTHFQPFERRRTALVSHAATLVDQQLIELFTHLFEAMLNEPRLPPEGLALLSRLQPPALRIALRDPGMLDTLDHAVWQFIDQLALLLEFTSPTQRERAFGFAQGVVDHLVRDVAQQDAARFAWGTQRLQAFERHRFDQAVATAAAEIARLREPQRDAPLPEGAFAHTLPHALDVPALDTVPASLIPEGMALGGALPEALAASRPGDWLWLFLQGQWRVLRLMGRSQLHGSWMLLDAREGRTWALRQSAMLQLALAGLAQPYQPRSLVRDAAKLVQRRLGLSLGL